MVSSRLASCARMPLISCSWMRFARCAESTLSRASSSAALVLSNSAFCSVAWASSRWSRSFCESMWMASTCAESVCIVLKITLRFFSARFVCLSSFCVDRSFCWSIAASSSSFLMACASLSSTMASTSLPFSPICTRASSKVPCVTARDVDVSASCLCKCRKDVMIWSFVWR